MAGGRRCSGRGRPHVEVETLACAWGQHTWQLFLEVELSCPAHSAASLPRTQVCPSNPRTQAAERSPEAEGNRSTGRGPALPRGPRTTYVLKCSQPTGCSPTAAPQSTLRSSVDRCWEEPLHRRGDSLPRSTASVGPGLQNVHARVHCGRESRVGTHEPLHRSGSTTDDKDTPRLCSLRGGPGAGGWARWGLPLRVENRRLD